MILGIVLGIIIGLVNITIAAIMMFDYENTIIKIIISIILLALPTIVLAEFGKYEENLEYLQYIHKYQSKKADIEKEYKNKSVEELEKINLYKNVINYNSELAANKIKYKAIYYFVDYSLIEQLEPIKVGDE